MEKTNMPSQWDGSAEQPEKDRQPERGQPEKRQGYAGKNGERRKDYSKTYRLRHPDRIKAARTAYYLANREKIKAYGAANRDRVGARKKIWHLKNRERCKAVRRAYYEKNRERVHAKQKAYNEANRDKRSAWLKAWREANRDRIRQNNRRNRLKREYGLPEEQFKKIFEAQDRKCAICGILKFSPVIDHCHAAGHVRGILCSACNTMIGLGRNSPWIMANAVKYLSKELIFNPD
jgi:ribosome modulation factor